MTALIAAELLKLKTIRVTWWMLATCLFLVGLDCLAIVATASPGYGPGQVHDPHLFALGIGGAGVGEVVMLVFGIMSITQEFRFRTDTASFLVTPRRGQLIAAKLVAVALSGAVFAALSAALVVPLSMMLVTAKGGTVIWDRQVAEVLVAIVLVMMLYGPMGIAVGALVRNQIGAIAGSLVWLMVVEQILIALFPGIGRWTPGGATTGVLQLGQVATTRGDMLPAWGAALLLAAYAGLTAVVGTHWTLRRDIT